MTHTQDHADDHAAGGRDHLTPAHIGAASLDDHDALVEVVAQKADIVQPTASEVWAAHLTRKNPRAATAAPSWKRSR